MKKSFKFLLSICLISTSFATSQEQNLNQFTSQSNIRWYGEELTGVTHFGNLSFKEAQIKIQDGVISSGKFVVDMTSLTVEDLSGVGKAKLTAHLKSDDFFSTEKHPEALLTITQNANWFQTHLKLSINFNASGFKLGQDAPALPWAIQVSVQVQISV